MVKFESANLEEAFKQAASHFSCSITELEYAIVQNPSSGFLGLFKKSAIIVATCKKSQEDSQAKQNESFHETVSNKEVPNPQPEEKAPEKPFKQTNIDSQRIINDTIMPVSFVQDQDDDFYEETHADELDKNYFQEEQNFEAFDIQEVALSVKDEINHLFRQICFDIDAIDVKVYDESTLLVEISGEDSALLIGKEGYRYKALSYMIFNWINSKYQLQLRLEIAEFLKNQEESVSRYLIGVCETIEREGRAQTKILDGVLVQIALKQLREIYPDKYVAIRSTREGLKFVIVNDYNGY